MNHDPYGYEGLDVYTFGVNFNEDSGFNVAAPELSSPEPSPAAHPRLEGSGNGEYFVTVDPGAASPDGEQPFTVYGPYSTSAAAQSLIDDGTCDPAEAVVVRLFYPAH